jgi:hypothetical protein
MLKVFNSEMLNRRQRFPRALLAGLLCAVGLGIAYGMVTSLVRIEAEIFYLGIGWTIGMVIQKAGHGVGVKFAVLGAVLTLLAVLIGDSVSAFGLSILVHPSIWGEALKALMQLHLSTNISNLLGLLFRAAGIYFGYNYSSIV